MADDVAAACRYGLRLMEVDTQALVLDSLMREAFSKATAKECFDAVEPHTLYDHLLSDISMEAMAR